MSFASTRFVDSNSYRIETSKLTKNFHLLDVRTLGQDLIKFEHKIRKQIILIQKCVDF
jgi:hypothetical protein